MDATGEVVADQIVLASVVAVRRGRMVHSVPATSAAGQVGDEGSFGAAHDVGPGIAEGTVPVATSDVAMVGVGQAIRPDPSHGATMTTTVKGRQRCATEGLR